MIRRKPNRRFAIRRESRTRAVTTARYRKVVAAWKVGRVCAFPKCRQVATSCHHVRGRIGRLLLDERFWVPVCRVHHARIHARPAEARALGLLAQPGQWNTVPKEDV